MVRSFHRTAGLITERTASPLGLTFNRVAKTQADWPGLWELLAPRAEKQVELTGPSARKTDSDWAEHKQCDNALVYFGLPRPSALNGFNFDASRRLPLVGN